MGAIENEYTFQCNLISQQQGFCYIFIGNKYK